MSRAELSLQLTDDTNFIHIFSTKREGLSQALCLCLKKLKQDGMIWVSWPKKSSKIPTEITDDTIREMALPLGLVDIKVCALDEIWSCLKLVIRKRISKSESYT
ncbi:MAG: DUF3052 family protein [Candidatus Riflebacteria bacterium]|nr:DUF3052 family protein [Candidatus Riflebacteria bacterium]